MRVSVVVPAYNEEDFVGPLLSALEVQREFVHKVVIADNASTDGTASAIEAFAAGTDMDVSCVHEMRPGVGSAFAACFEALKDVPEDHVICMTGADSVPGDGWLRSIVSTFADETVVAATGPYACSADVDAAVEEELGLPGYFASFATLPTKLEDRFGRYRMHGPNCAIRRVAYDAVGGMRRIAIGENEDLSYRLITNHYSIDAIKFEVQVNARRHLREITCLQDTYTTDADRILPIRDDEMDLLGAALDVPVHNWLTYQAATLGRIAFNAILRPVMVGFVDMRQVASVLNGIGLDANNLDANNLGMKTLISQVVTTVLPEVKCFNGDLWYNLYTEKLRNRGHDIRKTAPLMLLSDQGFRCKI